MGSSIRTRYFEVTILHVPVTWQARCPDLTSSLLTPLHAAHVLLQMRTLWLGRVKGSVQHLPSREVTGPGSKALTLES